MRGTAVRLEQRECVPCSSGRAQEGNNLEGEWPNRESRGCDERRFVF